MNGKGVPQDYSEATKWLRMAADQGHAEAIKEEVAISERSIILDRNIKLALANLREIEEYIW